MIETADPTSFAALDAAIRELRSYDWLLFTSANAVEAFGRRLSHPAGLQGRRTAAIGQATGRALAALGLTPEIVPTQAVAESLTAALLPHALQANGAATRFLLVRAEEAREHLPETLRAAGGQVTVVPAYRTVVPAGSVELIRTVLGGVPAVDAVTFTSASTVHNLFGLLDDAGCTLPEDVIRASIGPITSAALRDLGFPPQVEAAEASVESLAEALVRHLKEAGTGS